MGRKKNKEEVKQEVKICQICNAENELHQTMCTECGGFLPNLAALEASMQMLNQKYGGKNETKLYRLSSHPFYIFDKPPISTGSLNLDRVLLGGYPMTYRMEIAGAESSGKTTLALHACAEVQRKGGIAVYVDMEHSIDEAYAQRIGVNLDNLIIARPDSGTQALDIVLNMAPVANLIVLDSIAACASTTSTSKETTIDTKTGDLKQRYDVADLPRLMSDFQPKLMKVIDKSNCTYIFINQLRTKINQQNPAASGLQSTGGRAIKHLGQLIIWMKYSKPIYENEIYQGTETTIEIRKAKHMGGYCGTTIRIGANGVDRLQEIIELSVDYGIIQQAGAWYSYEDPENEENNWKLQGINKVKEYLVDNPEIAVTLEGIIRQNIKDEYNRAKHPAHIDEIIEEETDDGAEELEGDDS